MLRTLSSICILLLLTACQAEQDVFTNLQLDGGSKARYAVDKTDPDLWVTRMIITDIDEPKKVGAVRNYILARVADEHASDRLQLEHIRSNTWYRGQADEMAGGADPRRDDLLGYVMEYSMNFNFDKRPAKPKGKNVSEVFSANAALKNVRVPLGIDIRRCNGIQPNC